MTITTAMLTQIRSDVKDDIEAISTYGNIGTDSTAPTAGDTALGAEVLRKAITAVDKSVADTITISAQYATTEANGNSVQEVGVIDAATITVDNCDATTGWTDSADMTVSLNTSEYVEGGKSLNLTKDGTGSATASTTKTTTSGDFTSKKLSMWLYIADATALAQLATTSCITIRFGSDSSNYYVWLLDKSEVAVGWNWISNLTSSNADSTTGTPVLTAMDYTYVGITATASGQTWTDGNFIMDNILMSSGTLYTRNTLTAISKTDEIQLYLDTNYTITVTET